MKIINKSKHLETCNLSGLIKCAKFVLNLVFSSTFTLTRVICYFYYKNEHKMLPQIDDPVIIESVEKLAEKIRLKEITSENLMRYYIKRIHQTNGLLNFLVQNRFSEAINEAKRADDLINSGKMSIEALKKEKPLLGIPFTVKDAIMIKGMQNTSGMVRRKNIIAEDDAESVKNLIQAGAIPIALTNVPELCLGWITSNHLFGRTVNPYDNARIPGVSSGGEGCIQTIAGSAFGIGSDIGGSIRLPALCNGIFGHKPSRYSVSTVGQFPSTANDLQEMFLSIGPMCRKASDLKFLMKVLAKDDYKERLRLDEKVDLSKVKVYFQRCCYDSIGVPALDAGMKDALERVIGHMDMLCDEDSKEVKIEKFSDAMDLFVTCVQSHDYYKLLREDITISEVAKEMFKWLFGKSDYTFLPLYTSLMSRLAPRQNTEKFDKALARRKELEEEFLEEVGDDGVFLYPTAATSAPYHTEGMVQSMSIMYPICFNICGLPATHVPIGLDQNELPVGIQVVAAHNNDRLCFAVAEELERVFGGWRDPSTTNKNKRSM